MPCYLFTYHAYRSWMPDRSRGYVRRHEGILPADTRMARRYQKNARESAITFDAAMQRLIIEEVLNACEHQKYRCHAIATDPTHVHVLISWDSNRTWSVARNGIKSSLSRRLNGEYSKRTWFAESASRKRVKDRKHFDLLMEQYLPSHRGLKWREKHGIYQ